MQLLERLTDGLTKTSNHFSTETINVRLSSPDVPDLTVVDLPGIIRTSTAGQDPAVIAQVLFRCVCFVFCCVIFYYCSALCAALTVSGVARRD